MRLSATELASLTLLAIAVVTLCVLLSLRSCAGKSASAPAPVPVLTDTAACPPRHRDLTQEHKENKETQVATARNKSQSTRSARLHHPRIAMILTTVSHFLRRYWPSALTFAVIIYATLCSDPLGDTSMPPVPHLDKLIHAVMMGGLYGAIIFDTMRPIRSKRSDSARTSSPDAPHTSLSSPPLRFRLVLAAAVMTFGIADELAQHLMHIGRSADILDLLADWTGVAVAFFTAPPAVRAVIPCNSKNHPNQ